MRDMKPTFDTPSSSRLRRLIGRLAFYVALPWLAYAQLVFAQVALAPASNTSAQAPDAASQMRNTLASTVEARIGSQFPRFDVEMGEIDPRLNLAPCGAMEPFVPPGAQLWGSTRLGIRCTQGAAWRITVPVNIRVWGTALQLTRAVPSGQPVSELDVEEADVELSRLPVGSWLTREQLEGKVATRALSPGTVLRQGDVRQPMTIASGDLVTIVLKGSGFSISGEGKALGAGAPGQSLRVQTASGKILQGTVRAGRQVDVSQ